MRTHNGVKSFFGGLILSVSSVVILLLAGEIAVRICHPFLKNYDFEMWR